MRSSRCAGRNRGRIWTSCLGIVVAVPAIAQIENNPGYDRPGLGFTPAVLQPGDVMWEQGLPDWSRADGVSFFTADTLLRLGLGLGHALELQLGTGWSWLDAPGPDSDGRSGTSLALKFAPAAAGDLSWGLLAGIELTDGDRAFRNDQEQYLLGAALSWQHSADRALGLYLEAVRGDTDGELLAINDGWALTSALGAYVELALQHVAGVGHGSMAGAGVTWQATPRTQLDIGARHRLGGHADTWQGGVGFAVYFGD